ncbi:Hypothetical protein NGAL_HAMBI1146_39810 [Neorhizobium galegae bv. officinalis]|nr:Hypothetical protein NGAL_HAMBI1146_39810 [Neorhizobium galegae bv. officinalis]
MVKIGLILAARFAKHTTLTMLQNKTARSEGSVLRTQLQRIFDKTGVRSQAALVRSLLSVEAPNK